MRRVLAAGLLGVALLGGGAAQADPVSGRCGGTLPVDAVCQVGSCTPEHQCTPQFCLVWVNGCKV